MKERVLGMLGKGKNLVITNKKELAIVAGTITTMLILSKVKSKLTSREAKIREIIKDELAKIK